MKPRRSGATPRSGPYLTRWSGSTPRSGPYLGGATLLALLALASSGALAASPYGPEGKSWTDPPLGEVLSSADVVAECRVVVGGQWRAEVELVRVLGASADSRASQGDVVTVEGHNAFEWNTAHYAMRADDSAILALSRSGDVYTLPTPSSGRFPVEHGRIVGRFGGAKFLVEIPLDAFRAALEAYFAEPLEATRRLGRLAASAALETRCLALVLLGELRPGAEDVAAALLEPLARDPNPALREVAAHALGRLGGPHAAKALASFLTDADPVVARAAALAVCEAKSSRGAIRELFAWLARSVADETSARRKEDIEAQGAVFRFLAEEDWEEEAGPEERAAVVRGLVEMIASGRTAVCIVAARALGMIGAKEAVPGLIRLLDAEDMRLREEARSALLMITVSPLAARRDEMTRWWHGHKDEPRRRWVARALALAERSLAVDTYEAGMTGMMILIASRDPLAPWTAGRAPRRRVRRAAALVLLLVRPRLGPEGPNEARGGTPVTTAVVRGRVPSRLLRSGHHVPQARAGGPGAIR
ncbi:MAG: HEAT repeat domain-containing protein [Planctomycetota bacterium]|jgi:HEAT repeat protein